MLLRFCFSHIWQVDLCEDRARRMPKPMAKSNLVGPGAAFSHEIRVTRQNTGEIEACKSCSVERLLCVKASLCVKAEPLCKSLCM